MIYTDQKDADFFQQFNLPLVNELKSQLSVIFGIDKNQLVINKIMYKYWNEGACLWMQYKDHLGQISLHL